MERIEILVVDDDESTQAIFEQLFASYKEYSFRFARSGKAALSIIEHKLPDIMLLDIRIPGMNGFELLELLKQKKISVKTIIISGYDYKPYMKRAIQERVHDFIIKPIDYNELEISIQRALAEDIEEASIMNSSIIPNQFDVDFRIVWRLVSNLSGQNQLEIILRLLKGLKEGDLEYLEQQIPTIIKENKIIFEEDNRRIEEDNARIKAGKIPLHLLEDSTLEIRHKSYKRKSGEVTHYDYYYMRWFENEKLQARKLRKKDLDDPDVMAIVKKKIANKEVKQEKVKNDESQSQLNRTKKTFRVDSHDLS